MAGEALKLRECMIHLGVTGFDLSVYQVGRDDTVSSNQTRKLVEFFPYGHLRDVRYIPGLSVLMTKEIIM